LIFIGIQGAGKRMVMDSQKDQNKVRVQEVQSGRKVQSEGRQVSKPGGLAKERLEKSGAREIHAG
jgi:hypothetical protein